MKSDDLEPKLQLLDALQSSCTQCGVCLESCATHQATGWEHESPRGRILLAKAFLDGKIHPASKALETFDRCLGCRACEISCPENVQFHAVRNLVQELRVTLNPDRQPDIKFKQWIKLAWRIGSWRWRAYGWKWLKGVPKSAGSYLGKKNNKPDGLEITLSVGCVQDLYHHELIDLAIEFLHKLGVQVHLKKRQPCCGAIFKRLTHFEEAEKRQEKRKNQFERVMQGNVCFLSQNCQQFMANSNSRLMVIDLYQFILQRLMEKNIQLAFETPCEVYYQPYCSQKGKDFAWTLLNQMDGLKIKTIWPEKSCCGGCGGESFLNPEHASGIRENRLKNLPDGAVMVVTSFDCWMQYKQSVQVLYPIQLLVKSQFKKMF